MAEDNTGELLFQRGQDNEEDEDIWDDSALIKAYDEAVSLMKAKVAEQNGTVPPENTQSTAPGKQKQKKKKSRKNKMKRKWKVGDHCRAKFSEDGLVYEAEILSIDEDAETCYVRYRGYGNEEEQKITDLMTTRSRPKNESDIDGTDSGMEWRSNHSSLHAKQKAKSTDNIFKHPAWWSAPSSGAPGVPPFAMPSYPPFSGLPHHPAHSSRIPPIPPPPPPMCGDMSDSGDSEAMCSMLMSWYMSGYHTGYYQGLLQGRKESGGASSPYTNR